MKNLAISLITRLTFRSRGGLHRILNRFAAIEADSAWQLTRALDAINDDELKAKLFHNAMEEMHHADLFGRLAASYADRPTPFPSERRRRLFDEAPSLVAFEAYHYVGEVDVYNQFLSYARSAPSGPVRNTFMHIREDEEGHQEFAMAELSRLSGSPAKARALIRKVRLERAWESVVRISKSAGDAASTLLLSTVFLIFGALFATPCRRWFDNCAHGLHAAGSANGGPDAPAAAGT